MARTRIADCQPPYVWYQKVSGPELHQGDLLFDFTVALAKQIPQDAEGGQVSGTADIVDVVVMSQTCDLVENKLRTVLLCPLWPLPKFSADWRKKTGWSQEKICRELKKGNLPGYHLLQQASENGLQVPFSVVDFHQVYTASVEVAREFAASVDARVRLLPPYREQLAQAFARFFMRVGLPIDIDQAELEQSLKT